MKFHRTLQNIIAKSGGYYLSQIINWKTDFHKFISYYNHYKKAIFLPESEIQALQLKYLRKLLIHANAKVPFYSELFREYNFDPEQITNIEDISILPSLTRSDLQNHLAELTTVDISERKATLNKTGGSTGVPVSLYQCINYKLRGKTSKMIFNSFAGWSPGCRTAILWGSTRDLACSTTIKGKIHEYFTNYRHYSAYDMSDEVMAEYFTDLQEFQPDILIGYAELLDLFAKFILDKGLSPTFPVNGIISSAGTLFPDMRNQIQAAFNISVFNRYGSREVGTIACECSKQLGLHINNLTQVVQLEPSTDNPGINRVLVTNLHNYATPLIRYEIDDTSSGWAGKCSCNCSTPLLLDIAGRITSIITTSSGKIIYGGFRQLVSSFTGIARYQFVQEEISKYILRVVPNKEFKMEDVPAIRNVILNEVGIDSIVEIEVVDNIPLTNSGKHLYTISKVPANFTKRYSQ